MFGLLSKSASLGSWGSLAPRHSFPKNKNNRWMRGLGKRLIKDILELKPSCVRFDVDHPRTVSCTIDSPIGVGDQKVFEGMKLIDHPITGRKTLAIDPKQLFQNKNKE